MSTEIHTMKLDVDASGAKSGSDQFAASIQRIGTAVQNMERVSEKAFQSLKVRLGGLDFSKIAKDVAQLGSVHVNATSATNLQRLGTSLALFRRAVPNAGTSAQLSSFAAALRRVQVPAGDTRKIFELAQAIKGFRAPSEQQTANLRAFVTTLNGMKINANVDHIVTELAKITIAAKEARAALTGIGGVHVSIPNGLRGSFGGGTSGGGYGGGNRGYGPRSSLTPGPYDGVFSGNNRATGAMRGMENVANPGYQMGTVMRAVVPAITAGAGLTSLYQEGAALTLFQHSLENVTTVNGDVQKSMENLAASMKFATDISMKFGLDIDIVRQQWGRFAVTARTAGFSDKQSQEIFSNLSSGARSRGLTDTQIKSLFNAFDQAMSTGHFSMMQLHREMGLYMPASALMAKALNKSPTEIMEMTSKGQIGAGAALPLSRVIQSTYAPGLETALNSPQSGLARLRTQWKLTLDEMNANGAWDAMGKQFNRLADLLRRSDVQDMFVALAYGIADGLRMMGDAVVWAADHMNILIPAFKTFLALGAMEAVLRIGGAFRSLTGLVSGLVGPLARATEKMILFTAAQTANAARGVGGLVSRFVSGAPLLGGGAAAAEGAAGAAAATEGAAAATAGAAAATAGFGALAVAGTVAAAAVVAGMVAVGASLYLGRDQVVQLGNEHETVAEWCAGRWDSFAERFGKMWDSIKNLSSNGLSAVGNWIGSWAGDIIHAIGTTIDAIKRGIEDVQNLPHNAMEIFKGGLFRAGYTGPTTQWGDTERDWGKDDAQRRKDAADLVEAKRVAALQNDLQDKKDRVQSTGSDTPAPPTILPGKAGHGKSELEKAQDAFDSMLKSLTPAIAMLEKFNEEMDTITRAQKAGAHSKGTLDMANAMKKSGASKSDVDTYVSGEYDRARAGVNDSMLESAGAVTAQAHAEKELSQEQEKLNALVKIGTETQGKYGITQAQATVAMDRSREALAADLDPFGHYIKNLDKENELLKLGSKAREIAVEMRKVEEEEIKKTGIPLTDQEIAQLKQKLELQQRERQEDANKNVGLQAWGNSFQDLGTEIGKIEQKIPDMLSDVWAKFVTTGKISIMEVTRELEADLMKTFSKEIMRQGMEALGIIKPSGSPGSDPNGSVLIGGAKTLLGAGSGGSLNGNGGGGEGPSLLSRGWNWLTGGSGNGGGGGGGGGWVPSSSAPSASDWQDTTPSAADGGVGVLTQQTAMPVSYTTDASYSSAPSTSDWTSGGSDAGGTTDPYDVGGEMKSFSGTAATMGSSGNRSGGGGGALSGGMGFLPKVVNGVADLIGNGMKSLGGSTTPSLTSLRSGLAANTVVDPTTGIATASSQGYSTVRLPDGTVTATAPDGSTLHIAADGTRTTTAATSGGFFDNVETGFSNAGTAIWNGASNLVSDVGSGIGSIASGVGNGIETVASGVGDAFSSAADFFGGLFSEGGYSGQAVAHSLLPATAWANAPHYADGTENTSGGMPSILHPDEAVIPLSRGRKIPVDLGPNGQNGGQLPLNVTMHVTATDADSFMRSQGQIASKVGMALQRAQGRNG